MATLNIQNVSSDAIVWYISGLDSPFNTTNYNRVTISSGSVPGNGTTPPSGIRDSIYATGTAPPGNQTPLSFGVTGLSPNTQYTFNGSGQIPDGRWYPAGSATFWTRPTMPSNLTGLNATPGNGSVQLSWSPSSNVTGYDITWSSGSTSVGNVTSANIGGLTNGTVYFFTVTPKNYSSSSGLTAYGGSSSVNGRPVSPTPGQVTSLSVSNIMQTSATLNWTYGSNTSYVRVFIINGESKIVNYPTTSVTFFNLSPGTGYDAGVTPYNAEDISGPARGVAFTTSGARPPNFQWSTLKIPENPFNVLAEEWNRLGTRINEFRTYKNLSQVTFTYAYIDADFLATIFNQIINAISPMNPPTSLPSTQSSGNDIYANDIYRIRDALNSIP